MKSREEDERAASQWPAATVFYVGGPRAARQAVRRASADRSGSIPAGSRLNVRT